MDNISNDKVYTEDIEEIRSRYNIFEIFEDKEIVEYVRFMAEAGNVKPLDIFSARQLEEKAEISPKIRYFVSYLYSKDGHTGNGFSILDSSEILYQMESFKTVCDIICRQQNFDSVIPLTFQMIDSGVI